MAGDPADVGSAPEHILFSEVEDPLRRGIRPDQISPGRVNDPFWFPSRAGCIEDVEHVLRIHRFWIALRGCMLHERVIPMIAAFCDVHRNRTTGLPPHDNDVLDGRCVAKRFVRHLFERDDVPAPVSAVSGHEHDGLGVVDPVAKRLSAEASKHDAMNSADTRAGQHGDCQLRYERQVERDPITFLDAERLQHVGERADVTEEIPVRECAAISGLSFPHEGGLIATGSARVPVDAVGARVQFAANEPLRVWRFPAEHFVPGTHPLEFLGEPGPEPLRIGGSAVVYRGIGNERARTPRLWRGEPAVLF